MLSIKALVDELAAHPDYRTDGRHYIEGAVAAHATTLLGLPHPGHLPAGIPDATAQAIRDAITRDYVEDDHLDGDRADVRDDIRILTARIATEQEKLKAMMADRDNLIRKGIALDVDVADLAADADLKPARIYQIRDGRR